jgi:tetratricopeptide (TPR) repeat protein
MTLPRAVLPLAVVVWRTLLDQDPAPAEAARLLNKLSTHLAASGDRAGALAAIRRAVAIFEDLAAREPAAYAPDLARSLYNLALRLAQGGEGEEARALARQARELLAPHVLPGTEYADLLGMIDKFLADWGGGEGQGRT